MCCEQKSRWRAVGRFYKNSNVLSQINEWQSSGRICKRAKDNFFIIYPRTWPSSYLATAGYLAINYKVHVVYIMQKQPSRSVLGKEALEICIKFTGEHPCRSASLIRLLWSPVSLLYTFRTHFKGTPIDNCFWLRQNRDLVKISDQEVTVQWKK